MSCLISDFHREVDGTADLLGYYVASSGIFSPTFWNNLSVSSGFRNPKGDYFGFLTLKMGPRGCTEASVRNCPYLLRNDLEERSS